MPVTHRLRVAITLLALISIGCFGPHRRWIEDMAWSPDGRQAAVIRGGLRLSDRQGNLSPVLAPDVYRVAWLGDSERLVVARARKVRTFAEISAAVGPERARQLALDAEHVWGHMQAPDWSTRSDSIEFFKSDAKAWGVYLAERHGDELRRMYPDETGEADAVDLHAHEVVRVSGDRLDVIATLSRDLTPIKTIRPDERGRLIAFVTRDEGFMVDTTARVFIAPVDGATPPLQVAEATGESVDWIGEGASLVYFDSQGNFPSNDTLGCIAMRKVVNEKNALDLEPIPRCAVDVIFKSEESVRTLRDGRLIFDSYEHRFPRPTPRLMVTFEKGGRTSGEYDPPRRPQLFAFDPAHPSIPPTWLIPPAFLEDDMLAFFEVSPDRSHVIYTTALGRVRLLSVDTGTAELLPLGLEVEEGFAQDAPLIVWSGNDAFTYRKNIGGRDEYVLRRGSTEVVLSRNWPP